MTVILKSCKSNDYYVSIEIENRYGKDVYVVQVCPYYGDCLCGYPIKEMTYPYADKEKAYRAYRRYVKKYVEEVEK